MKLARTSPFSGKLNVMELPITVAQLTEYQSGSKPIQQVFPNLTPSQREFIMTGITDDEWPTKEDGDGN